jgi:hypothetical protein
MSSVRKAQNAKHQVLTKTMTFARRRRSNYRRKTWYFVHQKLDTVQLMTESLPPRGDGAPNSQEAGWVCEICGFHGGDYEECRLLGYKNPVHTSQGTNYVSATEPRRLMLGKI